MIDVLDHFATTVIDSARSYGPCHDAIEDMVGQDDSDGLAHYARKGDNSFICYGHTRHCPVWEEVASFQAT